MKQPGNINAYVACPMKFGRTRTQFDGTTKNMVTIAVKLGAKDGSVVHADFGAGMTKYVIYSNPTDARALGFWARRV